MSENDKEPPHPKIRKKKKNNHQNFSSYAYKVLKQKHPDIQIEKGSITVINDILVFICGKIAVEAGIIARRAKKKTITDREIKTAVRLIFSPKLAPGLVLACEESIQKYVAENAQ